MSLYILLYTLYLLFSLFFFFNDTATTEIYTLSLHDALPISRNLAKLCTASGPSWRGTVRGDGTSFLTCTSTRIAVTSGSDRKSTRLNSSHSSISYAVFCLKKKKKK